MFQVCICDKASFAYYIHCHEQKLNLVSNNDKKYVLEAAKFFSILGEPYIFTRNSS